MVYCVKHEGVNKEKMMMVLLLPLMLVLVLVLRLTLTLLIVLVLSISVGKNISIHPGHKLSEEFLNITSLSDKG